MTLHGGDGGEQATAKTGGLSDVAFPHLKIEIWGTRRLWLIEENSNDKGYFCWLVLGFSGLGWAASHLSKGMVKAKSSCFLSAVWTILT